jgi:hypothetical protein
MSTFIACNVAAYEIIRFTSILRDAILRLGLLALQQSVVSLRQLSSASAQTNRRDHVPQGEYDTDVDRL